jgi:sulfur-oxidizing protein SoxY
MNRRQSLAVLSQACAASGWVAAGMGLTPSPAQAQDTGGDPLGTLQWPGVRKEFLGDARFAFDAAISVRTPTFAEDAMNVPVLVDASAYTGRVQRIVVVVDRNPIRKVLDFEPLGVQARIAFRFKLQQSSAIRALVQLDDGTWRVGSGKVDASGGGCTLPGATRADGSWVNTLGQVQAQVIRDFLGSGHARLRLRVMHPMDTGLVNGLPAYYLEQLEVAAPGQGSLLRIRLYEPVSENPLLTFDLMARPPALLHITGRDNSALRIDAQVRS